MLPAGTVCPVLLPIGSDGVYLLSGGRENAAPGRTMAAPGCREDWGPATVSNQGCQNFDVVLWAASTQALVCGNNCSEGWSKYSISHVHNALVAADQPHFTAEINNTRFQSSSYTSMYDTGNGTAILLYNLASPGICPYNSSAPGCKQAVGTSSLWAMKIHLVDPPAAKSKCSQLDCQVYVDGSADRVCNSSVEAVASAHRYGFEPDVYIPRPAGGWKSLWNCTGSAANCTAAAKEPLMTLKLNWPHKKGALDVPW